jgi:hypothetical protein
VAGAHSYSVTATSADGLTTTSFITYTVSGPPIVVSIFPSGGFFAPNQPVTATFQCLDNAGGPGIASCLDSNGSASPGTLDTTTLGTHIYSVTATSLDGQTGTSAITYTVADPPTATITSPAAGGTYALHQVVPTNFNCSEGTDGPGLGSCRDSHYQFSPGLLDTSTVGVHTYSVTATSNDYLTSTTSITYSVVNPTTTTLTASVNPVLVGNVVTYTAQVSPLPDSGTVAFADNGTTIPGCSQVSLSSTGTASCQVAYAAQGAHAIVATYSGDATWQGSTSASFTETVNPLSTTTKLSSSMNPVPVGHSVTYTAKVGPVPDGGTVAFTDGATLIPGCTAVPVNTTTGKARCTVSYTTKASHSIVGGYSGNAKYKASLSGVLTERVA